MEKKKVKFSNSIKSMLLKLKLWNIGPKYMFFF